MSINHCLHANSLLLIVSRSAIALAINFIKALIIISFIKLIIFISLIIILGLIKNLTRAKSEQRGRVT